MLKLLIGVFVLSMKNSNEATDLVMKNIKNCIAYSTSAKELKVMLRENWIIRPIPNSMVYTTELPHTALKQNPSNEALKIHYKNYVKILDKVIRLAKMKYENVENSNESLSKLRNLIKSKMMRI